MRQTSFSSPSGTLVVTRSQMLLYENSRLRRDWTAENHSTYIQMQLPPEDLHQLLSEQSQPLLTCV